MKKVIRIATAFIVLVCCCVGASVITTNIVNKRNSKVIYLSDQGAPYTTLSQASMPSAARMQPVDLTDAAEKTVHGVVHIKSTVKSRTQTYQEIPDIFEQFMFGARPRQRQYQTQPQVGYGSGVILTPDGYIVTNNHVIEKADEIQVTLNDNRVFNATLVGADANTDLALIKIEGDEFPVIPMGTTTTCIVQPILGTTTMGTVGFGAVRGLDTDLHLQCGVRTITVDSIMVVRIIITTTIGDWFYNKGLKERLVQLRTNLVYF